ncbi:MAG: biopolymer transporter ExbD [Verrucomicrobiales bacterium]|jgi:biopolymer transport protein ExbD|nr:biopolymer transporter ExbD [Verrucomicrobiales bacterium]MDB3940959.1 biopolymer transporter ExbD [Verrucomicrobiales bacterium]
MASEKLQAAIEALDEEEMTMDMSSMIDLVFLLLIFFMVSSHLIIVQIDKRVKPPTAKNAKVAENATGRVVVNVLDDGRVFGEDPGNEFTTSEAITDYVDQIRLRNDDAGVRPTRLHLRADKNVDTREIKKVVQAAGEAGVFEVIFGSYVVDKD